MADLFCDTMLQFCGPRQGHLGRTIAKGDDTGQRIRGTEYTTRTKLHWRIGGLVEGSEGQGKVQTSGPAVIPGKLWDLSRVRIYLVSYSRGR